MGPLQRREDAQGSAGARKAACEGGHLLSTCGGWGCRTRWALTLVPGDSLLWGTVDPTISVCQWNPPAQGRHSSTLGKWGWT